MCLALLIPSALSPPLEARAALEGEALLLDETLKQYCVTCHNPRLQTAELSLQGLDLEEIGAHAEIWEGLVRKLRTRSMPPVGRPRPENDT